MAVRALAFDVFGTLVDWRSGIAAAFRAASVSGDPEELADDWRSRYVPILLEVNRGDRPWGNLDELHLATLEAMLAQRGIGLDAAQRRNLVMAWHRLEPWADAPDGLAVLRTRFITTALSNGHTALLIALSRYGGLRFDCLISAELTRVYKPAPEVYLTAARLLGVSPSELMLVAAHPEDLKAARHAGLRTAFIHRPLEHGAGSPARSDPEADVAAGDLVELAAKLRAASP